MRTCGAFGEENRTRKSIFHNGLWMVTTIQDLQLPIHRTEQFIVSTSSQIHSAEAMATSILATLRSPLSTILSQRCIPKYIAATRRFSISRPNRQDLSEMKLMDRLTLKGRNILVTGGSRGIGFAVCKAVAHLGGNVAVIDSLSKPVEEFRTLSKNYGAKTFYQSADVTDQKSLESAFSNAVKEIGPFQGCVPAAGIALDKPLSDHDWDESLKVLMVNTMGTFWTTKLVADHMREHGQGGSIVMIASVAAQGIKVCCNNTYRRC